jgi:hypothetical protein
VSRTGIAGVAAGLVLLAAACGGSGGSGSRAGLAAVCDEHQAKLATIGTPVGLDGAAKALRAVIAADRDLLGALDDDALADRVRASEESAKRALASIERTDPDRSMSPLRTGEASGRRVVDGARALLAKACATSAGSY